MISLDGLAIFIFSLYAATSLLLFFGTFLSRRRAEPAESGGENLPTVSVLVAARNEEKRLAHCIDSLLRSAYPPGKFEILIINDRSTDRTPEIATEYAHQHHQVKVVTVARLLEGMSGKASSLCQGMVHARGEILLITDADCIVPAKWMPAMVDHFTPDVGLVGGFTLLSPFETVALPPGYTGTLPAKVQTLDWMYLLTVGSGAAGLGNPVSILGNNFGFRRQAYEEVGGYASMGFTIIEDFALMRKVRQQTRWRVRFPLDPDTAIFSFPPDGWREFLDQRRRWAAGGKEVGPFAKYLMILAFLTILGIISTGFLSFKLMAIGLASKWFSDFLLLWRCAHTLRRKTLLKFFPFFEVYVLLYSFAFAPTVLLPATVYWKGVRYRWDARGRIKSVGEKPSN